MFKFNRIYSVLNKLIIFIEYPVIKLFDTFKYLITHCQIPFNFLIHTEYYSISKNTF